MYVFTFPCFSDDAHSVELTQFKEQFKSHLRELVRPVSQTLAKVTKSYKMLQLHSHFVRLYMVNILY